jgi:hypothetical protein
VYLVGFAAETTSAQLKGLFPRSVGGIPIRQSSAGRPYVLISFGNQEDADAAIAAVNGQELLGGRLLARMDQGPKVPNQDGDRGQGRGRGRGRGRGGAVPQHQPLL